MSAPDLIQRWTRTSDGMSPAHDGRFVLYCDTALLRAAVDAQKTELSSLRSEAEGLRAELAAARAFRAFFDDRCEMLFGAFGMPAVDLYNAARPGAAPVPAADAPADPPTTGEVISRALADFCAAKSNHRGDEYQGMRFAIQQDRARHMIELHRAGMFSADPAPQVEALTLAANRLARLALDFPPGSALRAQAAEWADEARAALAGAPTGAEEAR